MSEGNKTLFKRKLWSMLEGGIENLVEDIYGKDALDNFYIPDFALDFMVDTIMEELDLPEG